MIQCALYDSVLLNSFFMSFLLWLLGFLWRSQALPPRADCHLWCCAALDAAGLPEAHCRICRICRCTRPKKISKISFSDVKRHRKRHRKWHENDEIDENQFSFLSFLSSLTYQLNNKFDPLRTHLRHWNHLTTWHSLPIHCMDSAKGAENQEDRGQLHRSSCSHCDLAEVGRGG